MVKLVFLTEKFYSDYSACTEIERKRFRPHVQVEIEINGVIFCVPMRSNIKHNHVLWTDRDNNCGLDFSKAVVINNRSLYIDDENDPQIRQDEFNALRGKEHIILTKLLKYIKNYKEAKVNIDIPRNQTLVRYSTLKYFEDYI